MGYEVKVLADSVNPVGVRLTTMEVTFPRIVLAEFNTHRAFCLAGDAELEFDLPGGQRSGRRVYKMRLDTFVDRWHHGSAPRANNGGSGTNRQPMRERLAAMRIRQFDESTSLIRTSMVRDCCVSGVKEVFEVRAGRYRVAGSREHRVLTADGWKTIGELTVGDCVVVRRFGKRDADRLDPERLRKIRGRWRSTWQREVWAELFVEHGGCQRCGSLDGIQIHHVVPVHENPDLAFERSNVELLCVACHEQEHQTQGWQGGTYVYGDTVPVDAVVLRGMEQTYDLEIDGEFPNFIANGVVVHNSRNSASSRAIPMAKLIQRVQRDPFVPVHWGRNQKGMQARMELQGWRLVTARVLWRAARHFAIWFATLLHHVGLHKQIGNRLIEPWLWHTVIVTATEWENFFALRTHVDAQPEIRRVATMMEHAYRRHAPRHINVGDWHLPLVMGFEVDDPALSNIDVAMVSSARCARVSYLTHDGRRDVVEDLKLAERLRSSGHMSPFEHAARAELDMNQRGNVRGWTQLRKMMPGEAVYGSGTVGVSVMPQKTA